MKRDLYFEIAAQHSVGLRWITLLDTDYANREKINGRSMPGLGVIFVPRPDTLPRLRIFLHECAHCKLHRETPRGTSYHQVELEAERYAFDAITEAGIQVSRHALERSQWLIYGELLADLRAGFDPAPGVFEYLDFSQERGERLLEHMRALPTSDRFLRNAPGSWGSRQWNRS